MFGFGWLELLIALIVLGIPVAVLVLAVRSMRSAQRSPRPQIVPPDEDSGSLRCATCGALYRADYDACPHCAAKRHPDGTIDVTGWAPWKVRALLAGSIWPLLYIVLFCAGAMALGLADIPEGGYQVSDSAGSLIEAAFVVLVLFHLFTIFLCIALQVIYIIIAVMSPIPSNSKVLWVVLEVLSGMIVNPVMFYFLVWKPRRDAAHGNVLRETASQRA